MFAACVCGGICPACVSSVCHYDIFRKLSKLSHSLSDISPEVWSPGLSSVFQAFSMVAPLRDSIGGIFPSSIRDTLASPFRNQVLFIMGVIMGSVVSVVRRWGRRVEDSVHASPPLHPHTCPRQFILLDVSPIKRHLLFCKSL